MKYFRNLFLITLILLGAAACVEKPRSEEEEQKEQQDRIYTGVSYFAANCLSLYYLWNDAIDRQLSLWLNGDLTADPVAKVAALRYKQDGKDYDRWTEVLDEFDTYQSGIEGVSTTYGCDIVLMRLDETYICAVVTVVYAGSPAAAAGLRRGDVIVAVSDQMMTDSNYIQLARDSFLQSPSCRITLLDRATGRPGQTVSMTMPRIASSSDVISLSFFQFLPEPRSHSAVMQSASNGGSSLAGYES